MPDHELGPTVNALLTGSKRSISQSCAAFSSNVVDFHQRCCHGFIILNFDYSAGMQDLHVKLGSPSIAVLVWSNHWFSFVLHLSIYIAPRPEELVRVVWLVNSFIHSRIYKVPLQEIYSEAPFKTCKDSEQIYSIPETVVNIIIS